MGTMTPTPDWCSNGTLAERLQGHRPWLHSVLVARTGGNQVAAEDLLGGMFADLLAKAARMEAQRAEAARLEAEQARQRAEEGAASDERLQQRENRLERIEKALERLAKDRSSDGDGGRP